MENILANYERAKMIIASVFVTIFGVIMIYLGVKLINDPTRKGKTMGKVKNIIKTSVKGQYMINVEFVVNKQTYYVQGQGNYGVGDSVYVNYDTSNPANARLSSSMSNKAAGFFLVCLALIAMLIVYTITYFDLKSKSFAAVSGGVDVAQQVANIF